MALVLPSHAIAETAGRFKLVGVLASTRENDPQSARLVQSFLDELKTLGWSGDRNLRIAWRWGGGDADSIDADAAALSQLAPAAILAAGTPAVLALRRWTKTIPIVFISVADPVGQGIVADLAHPSGNITGFTDLDASKAGEWLRLLRQVAPNVKRVAVLYNRRTATYMEAFLGSVESAAAALTMRAVAAPVQNAPDIDAALGALNGDRGDGLVVAPDAFTYSHYNRIVELAGKGRVPAIYPFRLFVTSGGLMSYGIDLGEETRQAARYINRILSGEKLANLPIEQPSKFELVINLGTAKALGLDVPSSLLARATEVIE